MAAGYDGSGLTVIVETVDPELHAFLMENPKVAELKQGGSVVPAAGTRQNDDSPWIAGARIYGAVLGCSSGFSLRQRVTETFYRKVSLTSAHCVDGESNLFTDGTGEQIGYSIGKRPDWDLALINPFSGQANAFAFDGVWNRADGFKKVVDDWTTNWPGDTLCFSGSYTGIRCNIYVADDDYAAPINGYWVRNLIYVDDRLVGGALSGRGDSGGPAFGHTDPGVYDKLNARGVITGGIAGTEITCLGVQGRACYTEMVYMPVGVARNIYDARVLTH